MSGSTLILTETQIGSNLYDTEINIDKISKLFQLKKVLPLMTKF